MLNDIFPKLKNLYIHTTHLQKPATVVIITMFYMLNKVLDL